MIDFVLPSLGADMDEAMLVAWLVSPGDPVSHGQVIAEVETDKGVIEVECWHDGVIDELLREPGPEKLPVGTPLARIRGLETSLDSVVEHPGATPATEPVMAATVGGREPPPPIRHLAHTLGVDLATVRGSGPDGTITRDDVRGATVPGTTKTVPSPSERARPKASPRARQLARAAGLDLRTVSSARVDGLITAAEISEASERPAEPEPEDKALAMRRAIARSMSRSKREIPHYYLATRIDMKRALDWLDTRNEQVPITERILPAVLLLVATTRALGEVPELNGHWIDDGFVASAPVHLGVAVSLREGGLVAPAIHDADRLDLVGMMTNLRDLVARARSWRLRSSEMSDPTVTVTNLGDRGVEMGFPVIIPPQVAMIGFGRVVDEVVVEEGSPVVHPVVHATLAADHRATDGHRGGLFLSALDRLLQEPESL